MIGRGVGEDFGVMKVDHPIFCSMNQQDGNRGVHHGIERTRLQEIDAIAAAVILQDYLDHGHRGIEGGAPVSEDS